MGKLIILVVLGGLVALWLVNRLGRRERAEKQAAERRPASAKRGSADAKDDAARDMVACAHCGVHIPRGEAAVDGVLNYCGEPHRLLGPKP